MGLAEKMQLPVAVLVTAKAVIDETFPLLPRPLQRQGQRPQVREAVEGSDCLLSIGYRPIDPTSGGFTASLPADRSVLRGTRWTSARTTTRR